uniref:Uncharacterized protein n=1 Tax=Pyramimonas obovata TaxID=1411642 RepID=A0A7S0R6H3_9CHLO|mmetsp:Transcript_26849/g.58522  ORF Transcript_26849/g.58522 Transcript_26849/m.58522 type:complete len:879 (+) Transcript_26849:340-2976(+)|eukprot:CAMPEP_0118929858 /NCGR_PEP_ID=MMETSP1169-20130426/6736_1 /TAXON_ID=36882 /ORGANISM="Pyramimonas obovata, Strain CCMP722" /LENGTH=878 /DNA_ID=CAMNT_0006872119 /DNA_START=333 /DNA_END=2969 /DNA_ORIENTATION=-
MSSIHSDSSAALSEKPQGVLGALKFFLSVVYEETFAYQTIKLVRTYDWRLSLMKRVFTSGVLLYIIFFIVLFHGYVEYEAPTVVINPTVRRVNEKMLPFENATTTAGGAGSTPNYCFGVSYIYFKDVYEFINNFCVDYLALPEFTVQRVNSVGVTTYARQREMTSTNCPILRSKEDAKSSTCKNGENPEREARGSFVQGAEDIQLVFKSSYITSYGASVTEAETTFTADCALAPTPKECRSFKFEEGQPVILSLKELMFIAGVNLDAENEDSGGIGVDDPDIKQTWPTYRMTGMRLILSLKYENFFNMKPFFMKNILTVTVVQGNQGAWTKVDERNILKTMGFKDGTQNGANVTARDMWGVEMIFSSTSQVGRPSMATFLVTLLGSMVLLALATSMVDITAGMIIQGFRESKYEMDLDLRIKTALRMHFLKEKAVVEDEDAKKPGDNNKLGQMLYNLCCLEVGDDDELTMEQLAEIKRKEEFEREKDQLEAGINYVFLEPEHILAEWQTQMEKVAKTKKAIRRAQVNFRHQLRKAKVRNGEFIFAVGEPNHVTSHAKFQWCYTNLELQDKDKFKPGMVGEYNPWIPLKHATSAAYFVSANDVGHLLMCIIQPIRNDGQLGPKVVKITNLVRTDNAFLEHRNHADTFSDSSLVQMHCFIEQGTELLPAILKIDGERISVAEVDLRQWVQFLNPEFKDAPEHVDDSEGYPEYLDTQLQVFKDVTKAEVEKRVQYIQRMKIAAEEASSNKGLLKIAQVLEKFGTDDHRKKPLADIADIDEHPGVEPGTLVMDDKTGVQIKIPFIASAPMDEFLELHPSPNDGIYLQLSHAKETFLLYIRFDVPLDRDVTLAIVKKRRVSPPMPQVPPQGTNWVNEVLNDPA